MTNETFETERSLHLSYDFGVVTNASMKRKVSTVCFTQADWGDESTIEARGELSYRGERIIRHAKRASEHIGGTAGENAECRRAPGETRGHLIEGAVTSKGNHGVETAYDRVGGKAGGVTAFAGFHHLNVVVPGQVLVDLHGVTGGHRGGKGVDYEQDSQAISRYLSAHRPCRRGESPHWTHVTPGVPPTLSTDSAFR